MSDNVVKIECQGQENSLNESQRYKLLSILCTRTIFGYNSNKYDIPMVLAAMQGFSCEKLKQLSDKIISDDLQQWQTLKILGIELDRRIDTFDLSQVGPGVFTSLKLYGGRLNSQKLQDLPYDPEIELTEKQMEETSEYCINDLDTTIDLYNALKGDLELREYMSKEYCMDLRSKGGAQITEAIVKKKLNASSNKRTPPKKVSYQSPDYIEFHSNELQEVLEFVNIHRFTVSKEGYVQLPTRLTKPFKINNTSYKVGIGGLHSQEKNLHVKNIMDSDVVSYYPSIMLNNNISPPQLGSKFLLLLRSLFNKRIEAKKNNDIMKSNSLKLILNSAFGKLSNRWSCMYDPGGMLNVTLTGQLALLMLIEKLENIGCQVYSANTDGIVHDLGYNFILDDWQKITGLQLEHTEYNHLYARDVNNYIAIKKDGKVKTKGVFAEPGLRKNPAMPIVYKAVVDYLSKSIPIEDTIRESQDITQFLTVRTVKGGAKWRENYLGKVVRFYWSTDGEKLVYAENGNKVPTSDSSTPLMQLGGIAYGVDYQRYINEANKILGGWGL